MKTTVKLLITLLISISTFAQQGINYKAILKDTNGNVLGGIYMTVQFTVHETSTSGTIVYQEDHNYTTDTNGLVILIIGSDTSPSIGVFANIDWGSSQHFLQTTITYSGGTINFDATEFMAVPYAKHAETAANVFSGNYNDLTNLPTSTIPTGLEQITQYNPDTDMTNTGWRLKGSDPAFYYPIGENAVDLSEGFSSINLQGASGHNAFASGSSDATGNYSIAMGRGPEATNTEAVAIGTFARASGFGSFAIGGGVTATHPSTIAFGQYNEVIPDALLMFGNGYNPGNKSNALVIMRDGTITAPSLSLSEIDTAGDKALITKEYVGAKLPIAYGTIDSAGNILSGTGNFTVTTPESPTFQIEVTGETLSHTNSSTLVTPFSGLFRTASITHSNGDIRVYIFDSSGTQVTNTFQFVIYRL